MKVSRLFFLFVLSGLFSTGVIFDNADALEITHYYEENTTCAITTTSAQPVVVTDGTDFEFEDGSDYLIVVTSTWGGGDNRKTYEINLMHNATIFEGSQQIEEPKDGNATCGSDQKLYKYFFWTVWSPSGATEAGEDISLNYISDSGEDLVYDDVTVFVMELDDINPLDWYFDENFTDETLSSGMSTAPETTFLGSELDGILVEQPALFFKDNDGEDDDGFVDCIRVFDVALNSTTANSLTSDTDTCYAFPDTSIPTPIRIFDLNGNATDLKGGSDLVLSDGGFGLNATGWNFLAIDNATIVPSDIPNEVYAIEMVLSFEGFTSDTGTFIFPRILDWHNLEGAFDGSGVHTGFHADEEGQSQDVGLWLWNESIVDDGYFGGDPMTNNTSTHILIQRNSTGFFEAYKDGSFAFSFDDNAVSSWTTNSSASLTISPTYNDNDWLIFGNALLGVDDVATNFETRLNMNNETFTPLVSREGETTVEKFTGSFSRVFNLNNTQSYDFKIESRNDGTPIGTNERLYNSIFALNLNTFKSHNSTYYEPPIILGDDAGGEFNTELGTITIPATFTPNATNWFIFGETQFDSDKKKGLRLQVDDVDQPVGQTTQSYDLSSGWDKDDRLSNAVGTLESLTNSTHTVDLDAHGENTDRIAREISIFAFSLDTNNFLIDELMGMNDTVTMSVGFLGNVTDIMGMIDIVNGTGGWFGNLTSGMNMTDTVSSLFSTFGNVTSGMNMDDIVNGLQGLFGSGNDTMTMTDNATNIFGVTLNATETMTFTDSLNGLGAWLGDVLDFFNMDDTPTTQGSAGGNVTDTMTMDDNSTSVTGLTGDVTEIMTLTDLLNGLGGWLGIVNNTMTMDDTATSQASAGGNVTDIMTMIDNSTTQIGMTGDVTETMTLTDILNGLGAWLGFVNSTMAMDDSAISQGGLFGNVTDTMVQTDNSTMIFGVSLNATEIQSMTDSLNGLGGWFGDSSETMLMFDNSSAQIQLFGNLTDVMTMNDTSTMSIFMLQNVTDGMNMTDIVNGGFDAVRIVNSTMILTDIVNGLGSFGSGIIFDIMKFQDGAGYGFNEEDIVIPPPVDIPPSSGGGGSGLPVQNPDSDGDGILDVVDDCPFDPEDFDGYQDADGCPEGTPITPPDDLSIDDIATIIPFEFNQLDVVDDNVSLDTANPQPQVEDLTIRWLGTDPLKITSIVIGDSPFEITLDEIPEFIGSSQYGLTETDILYTVQEPIRLCVNQFTFDCLDTVTYAIPVIVTGQIGTQIIQSEGRIIIDNTDRVSYWWLIVVGVGTILFIFAMLYKRRRNAVKPKTKTLLTIKRSNVLGQQTVTVNVKPQKQKAVKKGSTRAKLDTKPTYHTKEPNKKSLKKINKKKKSKGGKMSNIFGRK